MTSSVIHSTAILAAPVYARNHTVRRYVFIVGRTSSFVVRNKFGTTSHPSHRIRTGNPLNMGILDHITDVGVTRPRAYLLRLTLQSYWGRTTRSAGCTLI
jgi:hypothetical protein